MAYKQKMQPTQKADDVTPTEKLTAKEVNLLIKEKLTELAKMEIDTPDEVVKLWKECIKYCFSELGTGSRESLRILEGMNKTVSLLEKLIPHLQADISEKVDELETKACQLADLVENRNQEIVTLKDTIKQLEYERSQLTAELQSYVKTESEDA